MIPCSLDERREDERAVGGAEQRIDGMLGVRHQAHHVAALVADARDVVDGAVARLAVAQHDLVVRLQLGDEALTPDSSRFWPADAYTPGRSQDSFDKQFVRDYCETLNWDKTDPGPEIPANVVADTRSKYIEAFERLTTIPFPTYLENPAVVLG